MSESLKRLYISGLTPDVTAEEIKKPFASFGTVQNVAIAMNEERKCRGFAHLSINMSDESLRRCSKIYNGSKWKGSKLNIELAKPDFMEILQKEWAEPEKQPRPPKKPSKKKKKKRNIPEHAADLSLVQDGQPLREGWKKGKFGRAVLPINIQDPRTRKWKTIDPSTMQHLLKRFNLKEEDIFNDKPSKLLEAFWEEMLKEEEAKPRLVPAHIIEAHIAHQKKLAEESKRSKQLDATVPQQTELHEAHAKEEISFPEPQASVMDTEDSEEEVFRDVDSEDEKPVQKKMRTEPQDKLAAMEARALKKEQSKTLNILSKMFADEEPKQDSSVSQQVLEFNSDEEEEAKNLKETDDHEMDATPQEPAPLEPESGKEDVMDVDQPASSSTNSLFQVNTNLRSLVFGSAEPKDEVQESGSGLFAQSKFSAGFSLSKQFGLEDEEDEEEEERESKLFALSKPAAEQVKPSEPALTFSTTKFFFMHFGNEALMSRSLYKPTGVFMRTGSEQQVRAHWERVRAELTEEYKRKHRSASRKKQKIKNQTFGRH